LFTEDLLQMYRALAELNEWKFDVLASSAASEFRGLRDVTASVEGEGVFGFLKYETGVHRVQRIPVTETGGRVHTSTAQVAVLPEASQVDIKIRTEDIRIDTYRASGAGGQHVNTTDSAVRVTHIPTNTVVCIQDDRSQHANKAKALKVLHSKLYEAQRLHIEEERAQLRRDQIGTGAASRSDRIRTYNFTQDRVTDHRVGMSVFGVDSMLAGNHLAAIVNKIREQELIRFIQQSASDESPN